MTYDKKAYEEWAKKDLDPAMVEWIIRTALVQIKEAGWRIVKLDDYEPGAYTILGEL